MTRHRSVFLMLAVAIPLGSVTTEAAMAATRYPDCEAAPLSTASPAPQPVPAPPELAIVSAEPPYREEESADRVRLASVRQSALSLGMRAGFARGLWCHQQEIARLTARLDRTYDFRALLVEAGGGFLFEPGIVLEENDDRAVQDGGTQAAAATARLQVVAHEHLVARPRNWRQYLLVDLEPLAPEHPANRPQAQDIDRWTAWIAEGWRLGIRQAGDTTDELWSQLDRDFLGMVTWRRLLLEHKLTPPKALVTERGVTGTATELRIGDLDVKLQQPSRLETAPARWLALPTVGPEPGQKQ